MNNIHITLTVEGVTKDCYITVNATESSATLVNVIVRANEGYKKNYFYDGKDLEWDFKNIDVVAIYDDESEIKESLANLVASKVVFEKNGFYIFICKGNFSVKGNFAGSIVPGLNYKITGTVGQYGKMLQITASSIELVNDASAVEAVIASFLRSNFDKSG